MKIYYLAPEILYEIEGDGSGGPRIGLYAKGHHSPEAFQAAFKEELGEKILDQDLENIRWEWWRTTPYGLGVAFYPAQPKSRGAFPVTVYFDHWPKRSILITMGRDQLCE